MTSKQQHYTDTYRGRVNNTSKYSGRQLLKLMKLAITKTYYITLHIIYVFERIPTQSERNAVQ
jgi:hypothetical protein